MRDPHSCVATALWNPSKAGWAPVILGETLGLPWWCTLGTWDSGVTGTLDDSMVGGGE